MPDSENCVGPHLVREPEREVIVFLVAEAKLAWHQQPDGVRETVSDVQGQGQAVAKDLDQDDDREDDLVARLGLGLDQLGALEVEEDLKGSLGDLRVGHASYEDVREPVALVRVVSVGLQGLLGLPVGGRALWSWTGLSSP